MCWKREKVNIIIEFSLFKLVLLLNFSLNWQFWVFWPDSPKKVFFWPKTEKVNTIYFLHNSAHSNWSSVKFQHNMKILIFWIKFAQKGIFGQKLKKLTSYWTPHIKISILVPNFCFNWQFLFYVFDQICPKRVFLV